MTSDPTTQEGGALPMGEAHTEPEPDPNTDNPSTTTDHLRALNKRQRRIVEVMVWEGKSAWKAAHATGIPERTVRDWMRRADFRKALKVEEDVLRNAARASNIHRLIEIRDQSKNLQAAVAAARTIGEEAVTTGPAPGQTVGWIIAIPSHQLGRLTPEAAQGLGVSKVIDVTPGQARTRAATEARIERQSQRDEERRRLALGDIPHSRVEPDGEGGEGV